MTGSQPVTAAEVLAPHLQWRGGFACEGCSWIPPNLATTDDVEFAAHQLDALKAAGYVVVELPKRVGGHWPVDPDDDFDVWRIALRRDSDGAYVNSAQITWGSLQFNLSGDHARALAGALLAAADDA